MAMVGGLAFCFIPLLAPALGRRWYPYRFNTFVMQGELGGDVRRVGWHADALCSVWRLREDVPGPTGEGRAIWDSAKPLHRYLRFRTSIFSSAPV
jgi:hypothetical protein